MRLQNAARRFWSNRFDYARFWARSSELLGFEIEAFGTEGNRAVAGPLESLGADVQLQGSGWLAQFSLEPSLVAAVVSRVVGKPLRLDVGSALPESLKGAFFAVTQQLARLASTGEPPQVSPSPLSGSMWQTDFWVRVEGASYRGRVGLKLDRAEVTPPVDKTVPLPISLPIVVARVVSTPAELSSLAVGDGFMFGPGTRLEDALAGGVELLAGTSERGLFAQMTEQGLVLRGPTVVHYDSGMTEAGDGQTEPTLEDVLLDAPVEVRVELGSITLAASEWLRFKPGDVITTKIPVGGTAILRSAGAEVGRGSLVNVDGQLGIKIDQLIKQ